MKKSLEHNIILFAFIILFMTTLAITGMDIAGFRRDYIQALMLRTQSIGQAMKASVEKVLVLGLDIRDIPGMAEKCRDVVQSNPEITYAVITSPDGNVLHSNDAAFDSLPLKNSTRNPTSHTTQYLQNGNRSFYDTSLGIRSYDGSITGYIHIGFPADAINSKVYGMALRSGAVFILFFLVSFGCVVFFVKRGIIAPIDTLLNSVKKIAEGNFRVALPDLPTNEFKELGDKIEAMAQALASRDAALRSNYEELASTHDRLRESYRQLEGLSSQLEKSETLYKTLLEDAGDAIIVLDQNETVTIANKKAEEFLGYRAEELLQKHISTVLLMLHASDIPHILQVFKEAASGVQVVEEITITTKRQEQVIGKLQTGCIKTGGQMLLQVIIRDVTRERELLNNLEKSAAELTRLNQMKDSFLGLASHELKTPLTVIMGYTELLLQDMQTELTPAVLEMTQNISNAAMRLNVIVRDMIDVSMIDRKKLALTVEPLNVNNLLEQSVRELRLFVAMRKQTVTLELDSSLPSMQGDANRLMQLFSNLLNNAIKFTPDGGTITLTSRLLQPARNDQTSLPDSTKSLLSPFPEHQPYIEVIIRDTGIGIDREDQQRIFEKFFEAGKIEEHSSGKVAFNARGTGLGLSIAKGVVEMHGGKIWVESSGYDPENLPGSTFFVLLPLDHDISDGTIDYMNI